MATKMTALNGKLALVTGGAKGIGRGCVEILAENGWKVAVWDVDDTEGAAVEEAYQERVFFRHCDVTNEEQIKIGITETVEQFGKLDCLVNNAGSHPSLHTIDDFSTDDFRKILEINLISCFAMSKYALPYLRQSKGSIVNISSVDVDCGHQTAVTYSASKAGISTMTRCLAIDEAKHGVRVNASAPGTILTPLLKSFAQESESPEAALEQLYKRSLLNRCGDPREMGKACLYLATDATYCTGAVLKATGGMDIGFGPKGD